MSDVFLSYAREDRPRIEALAQALEAHGWSVWWDQAIPAGRTFAEVIREEIGRAGCVVVAWTNSSVASEWVLEEAEEGRRLGILVPVLLETVGVPWGFKRVQAADLSNWDGTDGAACFARLMEDLKRVLGRNAAGASRQGSLEAVLASPAPPSGGTAPGVDGSSPKPGGGLLVWARRGAHGYLDALVGMITGPKGYLGSLDLQDPRALPNALTFFIASVAIAYVLELPFAPKEKAGWIWGATTIVFHCLKTIVVAGVLKMAFRLFGGRAPFRTHLLVVLYTSSVASLLWATFVPASKGIVLSSAPAQYDLFRDFTDELIGGTSGLASASAYDKYHSLWEAPSFLIAAGLVAVVAVMVLAWCILSWGAFRAINDVGRARSFLAWVVANSVGIVVGPLVSLAQKGLGLRLY